ncbi:MAG: 2-oxoacid:ferredoxin oxidoreductase subunit gamma [Candidatus Abyssobacteria bacterium SURF_17]|uniref:2-oxoacid:ferredoxin oxidoreductase subunit gamma n=1 Tax=Candidatus Abyssobacteria bacterium SURF_17 TaxID=2093361 RepID=A0A419F6J4_9BACT|nr:MAG: 2-oxoacid:ferredoxin oxidoreductase subunit gamma [Candidatus Abyssubacteria bacterium SURF_17]
MRTECRLCGSGGQGIILGGIILAEAAAIYEGKFVAQVQDYGPAARGDSSKTDVVISDDPIDYPKCSRLDLLVALSQRAYAENSDSIKEDGVLIVDSDNVHMTKGEAGFRFPMTAIARDQIGSPMSVNMVALGAIAALTHIVKLESLKKSVLERVPAHTRKHNLAALMAGYKMARGMKKAKGVADAGRKAKENNRTAKGRGPEAKGIRRRGKRKPQERKGTQGKTVLTTKAQRHQENQEERQYRRLWSNSDSFQ